MLLPLIGIVIYIAVVEVFDSYRFYTVSITTRHNQIDFRSLFSLSLSVVCVRVSLLTRFSFRLFIYFNILCSSCCAMK